jgi:hypothetical protein
MHFRNGLLLKNSRQAQIFIDALLCLISIGHEQQLLSIFIFMRDTTELEACSSFKPDNTLEILG